MVVMGFLVVVSVVPLVFLSRCADQSRMGSARILVPVAAKTAFATAGAMAGSPGSPVPVGGSVLGTV
jgi:hypothetical protein